MNQCAPLQSLDLEKLQDLLSPALTDLLLTSERTVVQLTKLCDAMPESDKRAALLDQRQSMKAKVASLRRHMKEFGFIPVQPIKLIETYAPGIRTDMLESAIKA